MIAENESSLTPSPPPLVSECVDFHYCHENYGLAPKGAAPELHIHPFYQLDIFPVGATIVYLEGRPPLQTTPWTGLLIPPMTGHGYASTLVALQVTFKFHLHPRHWLQFGGIGKPVSYPTWFGDLLTETHRYAKTNSPVRQQHIGSVITICLAHWLENQDAEQQLHEARDTWGRNVRTVLEMVAESPCRPWTVATLARHCNVSPDLFCRRFIETVGKSPRRFVLELRLRTAAVLLSHEDAPIKEVAREAGYATVHSFTRAFTNVFGTSPAAYLKKAPQR